MRAIKTAINLTISTILSLFVSIGTAYAHPVAYEGSYSLMAWNSKEMSDWMFTHSFTAKNSLSMRYQRIKTFEGERTFYFPHVNFLLKRWNELESQANVYLSVGHGGEKVNSSFKDTSFLAVEADWESRKYYVSAREEILLAHRNSSQNIYQSRLRAGFAPYLAGFEELNSWFILQFEKSNNSIDEFTVTPLIRLFYKNVLIETGVNQKGDSQFNFMVHF